MLDIGGVGPHDLTIRSVSVMLPLIEGEVAITNSIGDLKTKVCGPPGDHSGKLHIGN